MASPRYRATMDNLPSEVLSEIFIRLLVKQLGQMRCVCKSWNALLSESSFVKSHLHRSINKNDEILLFFRQGFALDSSSITACRSHSPDLELINLIKLPVIPQSKNYDCRVIGSVNGLICFKYGSGGDFVVCVWNPSLSAMLTLPPSSLDLWSHEFRTFHFQFGFDPKTDDYKVVKLTSLWSPYRMVPQVEVYSMKRGSWKLISQRFPSHRTIPFDENEVCVNGHDGHLHWFGCRYTDFNWHIQTIVAFDLGAETFHEIPLPDSILHHYGYRSNVLGVLAGKLCVMSCPRDGECEVWVMDEYGVAESWVKQHAFSQFSGEIFPFGFTSRNEFLFRVGGHFCLYDSIATKTKTFKTMDRNYSKGVIKVVEYVDSLVWVAPAKRASLGFKF